MTKLSQTKCPEGEGCVISLCCSSESPLSFQPSEFLLNSPICQPSLDPGRYPPLFTQSQQPSQRSPHAPSAPQSMLYRAVRRIFSKCTCGHNALLLKPAVAPHCSQNEDPNPRLTAPSRTNPCLVSTASSYVNTLVLSVLWTHHKPSSHRASQLAK